MTETKQCPYCSEDIIATAIKCKHCGTMLVEGKTDTSFTPATFIRTSLSSRYELLEEIGRGGMSVVYRAMQKNLDRVVALKVLPPQLAHDKDFLDRFHRESRSAARLSHPNIITIFDEGIENGVHFIAMELLEGIDLHQRIKQFGKLNQDEVLHISIQIARALGYAHQNGFVHRDVKSSNIFLCRDSRILLTDFGIAHAMQGTQLTMSGTVLGTPEFMSPEQADGKPVDERSDIYSLGVVMYYGLTGRFPFSGDNPLATIYKIINDSFTPISSFVKVLNWLELIVNACLEKNVNNRIPNCTRLVELLEHKQELKKPATFSKVRVEENRTIKLSKEQFGKLNANIEPKLTSPSAQVERNSSLYLKIIISLVALTLLVVLITQLTNNSIFTNNKDTTQIKSTIYEKTNGIAPSPPTLSSPNNGATNKSASPTLNWNANTSADSYILQLSTNSLFTSYFFNHNVGNVTSQQITGLGNSTTYYWRVIASNSNGSSSPSNTWSFTQDTVKVIIPEPKLIEISDFTNLPLGTAKKILENEGFRIGSITSIPSLPENTNMVLSQIPKSGTMRKRGTTINLVIGGSNEK